MNFLRNNRTPLSPNREARAVLVMLLTLAIVLAPDAMAAWSFWTGPSSGTGSAIMGTLQPPVNVIVPATSTGTVALSWTGATGTPAPTGYYVIRTRVSDGQAAAACGTSPAATIAGVSCNDLNVPVGTYTYTVTSVYRTWTATSAVSSNSVAVTASPATKLAFTTSPSGSTGGVAFGTQPVVTIQDASGATVTGSSASVTLSIPVGTPVLTCAPATASSGVATFAGCSIDKIGTYTLTAASSGLSPVSVSVTITVGSAAKLAFTTSPTTSTGGTAFGTQPVVAVQDAGGNTVTGSTASVVLSITTPAGATLTCTANPKAAVSGVATFAGCKIDKAGTYTLSANSVTLTFATSASVTITVGSAAKLAFTTSPSNATQNVNFATQPVVAVQDAGGNTVTGSTASVVLSITTPAGATLTCTANPKAAVSGVATFAGCKIDKAGTYTLTATATGFTSVVSVGFTIT